MTENLGARKEYVNPKKSAGMVLFFGAAEMLNGVTDGIAFNLSFFNNRYSSEACFQDSSSYLPSQSQNCGLISLIY
jgi:hypothetical protein